MRRSIPATSGDAVLALPTWGRAFWQDPNDGGLILLYASGTTEVDYVTSADSGVSWSSPTFAFSVDDFDVHNNFDSVMDRNGNVHCVHRFASSGCYTFIAKDFIGGGWAPSGIIGRGFVSAGDIGAAKGVNASIEVTDTFVGPFGFADVAGPFPATRIVAKDSANIVNGYWVPNPFDVFPILDDMSSVTSVFPAGREGGYPVFTKTGNTGRNVFYSVDGTGILRTDNTFGSWRYLGIEVKDPFADFAQNTPEGSGYVSTLPLGPTMSTL